jgi:hypothetical protein
MIKPSEMLLSNGLTTAMGFGKESVNLKAPRIMILSGSLFVYGPAWLGGGVVFAVESEGAYEDE